MTSPNRRKPMDARTLRHTLRFGGLDAALSDADLAQLHDKLVHLHPFAQPQVKDLCLRLRRMVEHDPEAPETLSLGEDAARLVQLAVYSDQQSRRRVSPALAHARIQAFHYLESRSQ